MIFFKKETLFNKISMLLCQFLIDLKELKILYSWCKINDAKLSIFNKKSKEFIPISIDCQPNNIDIRDTIWFHCDTIEILPKELLAIRYVMKFSLKEFNRKLKDISILSKFTYLTLLDFYACHSLNDISALSNLRHLTILSFRNCKSISNIYALSILNKLTYLNLEGCKSIVDISPLSKLTNLTILNLDGCILINDISALSNLTKLTNLNLEGCKSIVDISPLSKLTNLTILNLNGCILINNISALSNLTKLTNLNLHSCELLSDISPLSKLTNLTILNLNGCILINNISALSHLINLKELNLYYCLSIIDISPLSNLKKITTLILSLGNKISDIRILSNLNNLNILNLYKCFLITDISILSNLTNLSELYLSECNSITDISMLSNLTNLSKLYICQCDSLKDISSIKKLTNLIFISFTECPHIQNKQILYECHSLREIDYEDNLTVCIALAIGSISRNDISFINEKKDQWLEELSLTSNPNKLTEVLAKAFSLSAKEPWALDAFKKLIKTILKPYVSKVPDISLIGHVLCESLALGDPVFRELFEFSVNEIKNKLNAEIINGLFYSLGKIPASAWQWAEMFANRALKTLNNDKTTIQKCAASIIIFYYRIGNNNKANEWINFIEFQLNNLSLLEEVNLATAQWHLENGRINEAIKIPKKIKNQYYLDLINSLIAQNIAGRDPKTARTKLHDIHDSIIMEETALKIAEIEGFILEKANLMEIIFAIRNNKKALQNILEKAVAIHPEVCLLAAQPGENGISTDRIKTVLKRLVDEESITGKTRTEICKALEI
jgi:Leucine-rich repeat (LRR) protein